MPAVRRPIAGLLSLALGWTALVLGLTVAPAQADAPHDPATYYAGTSGLTGAALEAKLHSIIRPHTMLSYGDLWTALQQTDAAPGNPGKIIDVYSGTLLDASNMCNTGGACPAMSWNREHSWAKSHGDFGTVTGPGTDLFHMRPELSDVNSTRGNLDFDDGGTASIPNCAPCLKDGDSFSPRAAIRGDIARGLFYMAVAYDGGDGFPDLQLNDYTCNAGSKAPNHGKLSTLVQWSQADPPDDLERARNDLVDASYQHNRNPFIDHPEWVASIWGDGVGQGPTCGTTSGGGTGGGGGGGGTPPANIVISEAYVNGGSAGATYKNKFVEIYNPLDSTVDLSPYSLQYRSATGTGSASAIYNFASTARVAAHHYFVVQLASNGTAGGLLPQVDAVSTLSPGGQVAGGTLFLSGSHSAVAPDDDSVGDLLGYGTSNASETATATGYSVTKSLQRDAASSDTDDNNADFSAAAPTPGTAVDGTGGNPTVSPFTAASNGSPVDVALSGSDVYGDPLTWSVTAQPEHGAVSVNGSTATYTPNAGFSGTDVATVTAANAHGGSTSTSLTVTVTNTVGGGNHAPATAPMSGDTDEDTANEVPLVATDEDGDTLTWAVATAPANGNASVVGTTLTYTPSENFHGSDSVGVTVSDGHGGSASTTVTITVHPVNDAPTASNVEAATTASTEVAIPLAGQDVDGDPLSYLVGSAPAHGQVTIEGADATYTPDAGWSGPDSFTYKASDGTLSSAPATVSVTVSPSTNQAPTVTPTLLHTLAQTPVSATLTTSDPDGDTVTISSTTEPTHGSVEFAGAELTYTPTIRSGSDSFVVTVTDGHGGTATAQVGVEVSAMVGQFQVTTPPATRGTAVTSTVHALGAFGSMPSGSVSLKSGDTVLGDGTFDETGTAEITWTPGSAGPLNLTAAYDGDDRFAPGTSAPTSITVAKSASSLTISGKHLRAGKAGTIRVRVATVAGVAAGGKVKITVGSKTYKVKVRDGVAVLKVARLPRKKVVNVVASYLGDSQYATAKASKKLKLKR